MGKPVVKKVAPPTVLWILGKRWKLEYVNGTDFADAENPCGECVFDKQQIQIRSDIEFDAERDTLIHEPFHAIDHELQLGLKEKQVHRLACAFYDLMRANPEYVRYLMLKNPEHAD